MKKRHDAHIWDDILMIILAIISLILLWIQYAYTLRSDQYQMIELASTAIGFVFLVEFCVRLYIAPNRTRFIKSDWWMLLASIPVASSTTQALRGLQLLRLFRLADLLQLVRGTKEIEKFEHEAFSNQHK